MPVHSSAIIGSAILWLSCTLCFADEELLPPDRSISEVVDHYINAHLEQREIRPAPVTDDANLIRRTTLDLAGRIPTAAEVQAYVDSPEPDKREKLVDRLLASPDYAFHHANWLDAMLLGGERVDQNWLNYLQTAASEDRPWDRMFREMMIGNEDAEPEKFALTYLKQRAREPDDMTNDTSRLFFGVSINCAQCHDHPLADDWKQDHYFGFKSFFDRTYLTRSNHLAEKYSGQVKFKTTAGEEKLAKFMFLTGDSIEEPQTDKTKEQRQQEEEIVKKAMKDDKAPPPKPPEFSPRAEFVKLALEAKNADMLAKSIINRTWARFLGMGLVDPLDQIHSANPPSHPELLAWLTRDLQLHEYRLKRLIRGIILSDAYARSSRWTDGDAPYAGYFAFAQPRILTPRQYTLSLIVATTSPSQLPLDVITNSEDWAKRRESWERQSYSLAGQLEWPREHFQVSVDEALLFSNSDRVRNDYLRDSGDRLVGHLKTLEDHSEAVRVAFRNLFSRDPDPEELAACEAYLSAREDRPVDGLQQMVWALLTGPELRFNH